MFEHANIIEHYAVTTLAEKRRLGIERHWQTYKARNGEECFARVPTWDVTVATVHSVQDP